MPPNRMRSSDGIAASPAARASTSPSRRSLRWWTLRPGRSQFTRYMPRAPMAPEEMTCDSSTGTVIYRSRMLARPKRNSSAHAGSGAIGAGPNIDPSLMRPI